MVPKGSFTSNHIEREDLCARLSELLSRHFAEPMIAQLEAGLPVLPELPSLSLIEAERKRQLHQGVERDARSHPQLRNVVETFSGEFSRIDPLKSADHRKYTDS